ncbi:hypothetical protein G5I_08073 [Acromyrmex echinatior]|uniref:Uncharacterized protein n=1 Tax=Acromyrmex echinatior TaxID=103372 RepID=F4WQF5_ACREC|nr:hypothetical protein G5I_08073 [Acromyrmex echinatior]
MLDLKSSGTTAAELPRTTAFTNLSMLFADASSSYKGGWSHATSPAPGQGESHLSSFTKVASRVLCGALNRGPFVVDGERASERTEEREGEEGWQRASPGGCVETPARTVVTPKSRPHPVWTPTPTPGTIISQRSQRPARRHLCYKRLLAATNQVTTARALFEITSVGRENVKVLPLNAREPVGAIMIPVVHARWDLDRGVEVCVRETSATVRSPAATLIAADPTTRTDPGMPSPAGRDPHPRTYPLPNQKRNQIV